MKSNNNAYQIYSDILKKILGLCKEGDTYVFRGENKKFVKAESKTSDKVIIRSGLYRQILDESMSEKRSEEEITSTFIEMEKNIVESARQYLGASPSDIEVLTEIQHYRGKTGLIDFSYNLNVALFFACYGNFDNLGYLYAFNCNDFTDQTADIFTEKKNVLIVPPNQNSRINFQSSVLVHGHNGYIKSKEKNFISISAADKEKILNFLSQRFNINANTIYNDIYGFIENQQNFYKARVELAQGKYYIDIQKKKPIGKKNPSALTQAASFFEAAIKINPCTPEAHFYLGVANLELGKDKERRGIKNSITYYKKSKEEFSKVGSIDSSYQKEECERYLSELKEKIKKSRK